jgi:hypothetical protein
MNLVHADSSPNYKSTYHPRRNNSALFDTYEKILNKCGLSLNCLDGKNQHVIVAQDSTHPLRNYRAPFEVKEKYGIESDGVMRAVPVTVHECEVPSWTLDDSKVRAYLEHSCPSAFPDVHGHGAGRNSNGKKLTAARQRHVHKKLTELCAVLYLWFRAMQPCDVIANDLGIASERVRMIAQRARKHYPLFEAGTCRCKNRGWHRRTSAIAA